VRLREICHGGTTKRLLVAQDQKKQLIIGGWPQAKRVSLAILSLAQFVQIAAIKFASLGNLLVIAQKTVEQLIALKQVRR
jgi:hypothetical protein